MENLRLGNMSTVGRFCIYLLVYITLKTLGDDDGDTTPNFLKFLRGLELLNHNLFSTHLFTNPSLSPLKGSQRFAETTLPLAVVVVHVSVHMLGASRRYNPLKSLF